MEKEQVFFDGHGGAISTYGWVIRKDKGIYFRGCGEIPHKKEELITSNVAEYMALISALEAAKKFGLHGPLEFIGDSKLIILQMTKKYTTRSKRLKPLYQRAAELASQFKEIHFRRIFEFQNKAAHAMCLEAERQAKAQKRLFDVKPLVSWGSSATGHSSFAA